MLREMSFPKTETAIGVVVSAVVSCLVQFLGGVDWYWLVPIQAANAVCNALAIRYGGRWTNQLYRATHLPKWQPLEWLTELLIIGAINAPVYALLRATEDSTSQLASMYFVAGCVMIWAYREFGTVHLDRLFTSLKYWWRKGGRGTKHIVTKLMAMLFA